MRCLTALLAAALLTSCVGPPQIVADHGDQIVIGGHPTYGTLPSLDAATAHAEAECRRRGRVARLTGQALQSTSVVQGRHVYLFDCREPAAR